MAHTYFHSKRCFFPRVSKTNLQESGKICCIIKGNNGGGTV